MYDAGSEKSSLKICFFSYLPLLHGERPCSANALRVSLSSLKSILVPTRIIGASGQWCFSSGYHFDVTFSNEEGLKKI